MIESLEEIPKKIAPILKRHGVSKAALFGSFARREMNASSDIDILVDLADDKSLLDLVALKLDLEEAVGRKVDLVEYSTIHPRLRNQILGEQVPVI
jgi:uncharacterized protein